VVSLAKHKVKGSNAAIAIDSNPNSKGTSIFAKQGSPVIAVNDGRIVKVGSSPQLGHYIELQDSTGNIYTYSQLGTVSKSYPVPKAVKVSARQVIKQFSVPATKAPTAPASAGSQGAAGKLASTPGSKTSAGSQPNAGPQTTAGSQTPLPSPRWPPRPPGHRRRAARLPPRPSRPPIRRPRRRRRRRPSRPLSPRRCRPHGQGAAVREPQPPASYASGGDLQLKNATQQISSFQNYFSDTLHLGRNQYTLKPLRVGSIVIAGTILGRIGGPSQGVSPHLYFEIQPAGKKAPYIDPKPILDGWKLLEATAVYRAAGVDPFFGPGARTRPWARSC